MTEIVVAQRMWQRRDTAANWSSVNPVLAAGEIGVELPASGTQARFKIGTGAHPWSDLPYAGLVEGVAMLAGGNVFSGAQRITHTGGAPLVIDRTDSGVNSSIEYRGTTSAVFAGMGPQNAFAIGDTSDLTNSTARFFNVSRGSFQYLNNTVYHAGNLNVSNLATLTNGNAFSGDQVFSSNVSFFPTTLSGYSINFPGAGYARLVRQVGGGNIGFSIYDAASNWAIGIASQELVIGDGETLSSTNRLYRFARSSLAPGIAGEPALGRSNLRWSDIFSVNPPNSTSDAREKTLFRDMTDAEIAAGLEISRLPCAWKWIVSIEEKGEDHARWHFSPTVQDVIAVMGRHGLDPFAYGFVCYDSWPAIEREVIHHPAIEREVIHHPALPEVTEEWPDLFDAEGNLVQSAGSRVVQEARDAYDEMVQEAQDAYDEVTQEAQEAGDRYSLRPNELEAFCRRALAADRDKLEQRIKTLESK